MADDFIPLNQSTPVQPRTSMHHMYHNRSHSNHKRGGRNRKQHNSPQNSFGSNSSNNSYRRENNTNIDAYIHPSMLQDPWESLRSKSITIVHN